MYTAEVPQGDVSVFDLVLVADFYQVELLVDHCIEFFRASLSARNVVQRIIEIHDFARERPENGLEVMQVECWNFLRAHGREIKVTTLVCCCCFCQVDVVSVFVY